MYLCCKAETPKMKNKKKGVVICKRGYGKWKCNNITGENKLQLCDKHFRLQKEFLANNPSLLIKEKRHIFGIDTLFLTKKNKKKKKKKERDLPSDEQRCCKSDGIIWRCKNVRMWVDASEYDDTILPNTKYCRQHYFYELEKHQKSRRNKLKRNNGDSANCSNKRRRKEKAVVSEDASDTSDSDTIIANIGSKKIDETEIQPATTSDTYGDIIEGGSASIGTKRKNVRRTECSGELESLTGTRNPVVELESLERYKSECVKLAAELEKKKVECTTLQGKLAEVDTRMTAAVTDSTECWRKMLCDLESRLLRMEKEKSTFGGLESRVLNLENIVMRMDNENSTVAGSVESRILKLESLVMRSKKPFVNVVSDDCGESSSGELLKEDSNNSVDPKSSLGDLVYKLAMNNRKRSRDKEIKWKSEADMLSSFEEDPELCLEAVCALYRHKTYIDEISAKGLFHYRDAVRVTTLAKFLMDGDCNGDLKMSVEELEKFDSDAVEDCKMLARSYSKQLFSIYQHKKDPYFLPTTTDSHGDQIAK